ncbi:MAG: hypothetical protein QOG34_1369 [Frankiaceae bacterium]|nr:hypothetical protein [Frankiaceae bacterium]
MAADLVVGCRGAVQHSAIAALCSLTARSCSTVSATLTAATKCVSRCALATRPPRDHDGRTASQPRRPMFARCRGTWTSR